MSSADRAGRMHPAVALAVAWIATAAAGTSAHEGHEPLPTKGVVVDARHGTLALSAAAHRALAVETADVTTHAPARRLTATARLVAAWNRHAYAAPGIAGRVAAIHVRPGDVVAAGQPLATVDSLALETIQVELLTARAEHELAARTFARMETLAAVQAAALRDRSEARARLEQTQGAVDVAVAKLRSLGIAEGVIGRLLADADRPLTATVAIASPIAGTVVHVDTTVGDVVQGTEHLFEVIDLAEVQAEIQVLERDVAAVAVGQPVQLAVPAWPDEQVTTAIDALGMRLDPSTKLGTAWATVANPVGPAPRFLPGMTGRVAIATAAGRARTAVPVGAIVSSGAERSVFVEEAATERGYEYRRQPVVVEGSADGLATLADGAVFPGDRVVTRGSHQLGSFFVTGALRLSPEAEAAIGLQTEAAAVRSVDDVLEFDGLVDVLPGARTVAAAPIEGRITRLAGRLGQEVAAGDVVAEVASLAALDLQLRLIQASAQRRLATETLARLAELDAAESVPRKRVWEAQTAALSLAEQAEALGRSLRGVGLSAAEVDQVATRGAVVPVIAVRAPAAGRIVALSAILGQVIDPDVPLAEIHDPHHAWVRGHLTEREVGRFVAGAEGGAVRVRFVALPGRVFTGAIVRRGTVIDSRDRTLPVWVELETSPAEILQHDMLARVSLPLTSFPPALAVPRSAVAREGTQAYLFVREEDGSFRRQPVVLGRGDDRLVTIVEGLAAGAIVAVSGVADLQTAFAAIR